MSKKINLFVVDDDEGIRSLLARALSKDKYSMEVFANAKAVLGRMKTKEFDIGLIDINMPEMNGIELVRILKSQKVSPECIIITGEGNVPTAVEAMKLGCCDYLPKPVNIGELEATIDASYKRMASRGENNNVGETLPAKNSYYRMIGKSQKIKEAFFLINKVAKIAPTILVSGETGTGKELVAKTIHSINHLDKNSFVIVDCTSIPETLFESELFGHEKGAFTNALSAKPGLFELADKGTLFIDEITEMNLATQAKLLRAIETREFRRVGGCEQIKVNVRIIAATNRTLQEEVEKGNFRNDLYNRLNMVNIHLPSLRERKEDIPLLARYFIARKGVKANKKITPDAMKILMQYNWPGNIRELCNVVERALMISEGDCILPIDLPMHLSNQLNFLAPDKLCPKESIKDFERNIIVKALEDHKGNKIKAALALKFSRSKLYRKLKEYRINTFL
ncbi:MAG: sigma-54-dependent Fis family transcriptional regulator [Planctomycetes bacterium]|nr:sigma-54-dependent Fis family transcriptional regulator [Planctomycetota bacterium]